MTFFAFISHCDTASFIPETPHKTMTLLIGYWLMSGTSLVESV